MKKYVISFLIGISLIATPAFAVWVFTSSQIGLSPTNGYLLQTNGSTSTWVATSTLGITVTIPAGTYDPYGQATSSMNYFAGLYYATTTHNNISSLPALSITKSQVSDFGTYENALTFNYPLSRSVNAISTVATSSLGLLVNSFASPNISQWTNNSNFIALTNLSATNPITYNNTTGAIGWTNSNNYIALTDLSATYPLIKTSGVFSTAFSTTTSNIFSALNTFANASTTLLTANTIFDNDGDIGTAGQVLSSTGSVTNWINAGAGTVTSIATTYPITGGTITTTGTLGLAFGTTTSNTWAGTQTFTNNIVGNLTGTASGNLTTIGSGTNGNLAYWTGVNTLTGIATTTLTGTAPIVFSQPISVIGSSASAVSCSVASGSTAGCLSATNWTTFNNKWDLSSTTIANTSLTNSTIGLTSSGSITVGTSPISLGGTSALNLNMANANTWTALQTFANASTTNIGSTGSAYFATSGGNVGIGTTAPGYKLHVMNSAGSTYNTRLTNSDFVEGSAGTEMLFDFGAASGNTYARISALTAGETAWGNLVLQSGGGNVGIGTTNPNFKFEVNGTASSTLAYFTTLNIPGLTASQLVATDASKNLVSLTVATYPSLTELTYVKGVTSAIQTQLGLKSPLADPVFTGSLALPQGASPTVDAAGEIAVDTTSDQLIYYGGAKRVLTGFQYPSFSLATSTAWVATSTRQLGTASVAETWSFAECYTTVGTLNISFSDGTNLMNMISASSTPAKFALTTNNTFTAGEKRQFSAGTPATAPVEVSCTITKSITAD